MYEYLIGRVAERAPTRLVLEANGIGYDVAIPLGVDFRREEGADDVVRVWTHFVVREDAHTLYGFPDRRMREVFRLLLKVRGVGPGVAVGILSSLSEQELLVAVANEDPKPFTRIKGVGKKTADQILLDLRGKTPQPDDPSVLVPAARRETPRLPSVEDAIQALLSIGYNEKQARASVEKAAAKAGTDDVEALIRTALHQ